MPGVQAPTRRKPVNAASGAGNPRPDRLGLAVTAAAFLIGVVAIWLPPRPPMIDLPQFAGQIALLKSLIKGTNPWAANLRIQFLTPYLIGYALTLPLAFALPITAAVKTILTVALAAFGLMAAAIRRELGSARALDAYALIGFFGFNYAWGLYTFLVAAPLGLMVVWLSLRYARQPGLWRGLAVTAAGMVLLCAHLLMLGFIIGVGILVTLARGLSEGPRTALVRTWPFAAPLAGGLLVYVLARIDPGAGVTGAHSFGPLDVRLLGLLASIDDRPDPWTVLALIALAALPFAGGLRIAVRPIGRLVIAGAVLAALAFGPDWFWLASGVNRRFALFVPAAWAWLFSDPPTGGAPLLSRPRLALLAPALAGLILAQHVVQAAEFAHEASDFDTVMDQARPGQRAMGLILDVSSRADVDPHIYWHFPSWYQAEKGGLVDPSFAAGSPSIVRYRTNPPGLSSDPAISDHPERFDWRRDHGDQWTYFFVRGRAPAPPSLFVGASCPPVLVAARGAWSLYENRAC